MSTFNFEFGEDLPADLADAVRKSFSEAHDTSLSQSQSRVCLLQTGNDHSPIGTPIASNINLTSMTNPNEILPLSNYNCNDNNNNNNSRYVNKQTSDTDIFNKAGALPGTSKGANTQDISLQQQSDYQLFKHHYSVSENTRESITDILHELDIKSGNSISPQPFPILSSNIVSEDSNIFIQQQYPKKVISQQERFQQQLRNPFINNADTNDTSNMNMTKDKFDNDSNTNPKTASDTGAGTNTVNDNRTNIINQITTRRSSIQNVQWIRQFLNPRSSFSGPSQTKISVDDSFLQKYNMNTTSSSNDTFSRMGRITKCWVTILKDGAIESVKSMIVLYHSLLLTGSKYPMYVLHGSNVDVSELEKYNIYTVPIPREYFQNDPNTINATLLTNSKYQSLIEKKWYILSLFVSFINSNYELICYITPTSMIIDNIDELLDDPSINNEIDNETCVLLSNVTVNDSEEPQLIIFKPSNEVSMCIKEYFTLYGDDKESLHKIDKLLRMPDSQVLKELFGETWGNISSDGYVTVFELNDESLNISNFVQKDGELTNRNNAKILDFKNVKPWEMEVSSSNEGQRDENNVIHKWYQIWQEFWNTYSTG